MKKQFMGFCAAWVFLTRIPLPTMDMNEENFAQAPAFYPLVGLLIGGIGSVGYAVGHWIEGPVIGAIFALGATLLATGAFHEDGLADLFDGLGAQTKDHMLEVMRDSRLGTFGAAALFLVLGLKIAILVALPASFTLVALPLAHGISRMSAVLVIATSSYSRSEGTAKPVAKGISRSALLIGSFTSITALTAFGLWSSFDLAAVSLAGLAVGHVLTRLLFERKLGGYTGDCLGAVQQVSEVGIYLAIAAWL
ncbi:adenosylcobinamide-GDP ribazoletransferase [Croceicoccus sp. F390]|uniref:Adenosylcobinamide-GDP ribazoletransferase n=1 Tax=Croceicoccus esteveae TaxID=3075597 RepID=A0ABU2ZNE6_9SPHN|nr:adenosylcobinamide-GDP ribazoletransferase [Croceicoccus sp. F390]MDT0577094.1 adenosylcobinamide-GDP ribazoletransferase [Croceicoccus sp. F390]